jgi:hypothetical protein
MITSWKRGAELLGVRGVWAGLVLPPEFVSEGAKFCIGITRGGRTDKSVLTEMKKQVGCFYNMISVLDSREVGKVTARFGFDLFSPNPVAAFLHFFHTSFTPACERSCRLYFQVNKYT